MPGCRSRYAIPGSKVSTASLADAAPLLKQAAVRSQRQLRRQAATPDPVMVTQPSATVPPAMARSSSSATPQPAASSSAHHRVVVARRPGEDGEEPVPQHAGAFLTSSSAVKPPPGGGDVRATVSLPPISKTSMSSAPNNETSVAAAAPTTATGTISPDVRRSIAASVLGAVRRQQQNDTTFGQHIFGEQHRPQDVEGTPFHLRSPSPLAAKDRDNFALTREIPDSAYEGPEPEAPSQSALQMLEATMSRCARKPKRWVGPQAMRRVLRETADELERRFYGETEAEKKARLREAMLTVLNRPPTPPVQRMQNALDTIAEVPEDRIDAYASHLIEYARRHRRLLDQEKLAAMNELARTPILSSDLTFTDYAVIRHRFDDLKQPNASSLVVATMPQKGWKFGQLAVDGSGIRRLRGGKGGRKKRLSFLDVLEILFINLPKSTIKDLSTAHDEEYAERTAQYHTCMVLDRLPYEERMNVARAFLTQDVTRRGWITFSKFRHLVRPGEMVRETDAETTFMAYSRAMTLDDYETVLREQAEAAEEEARRRAALIASASQRRFSMSVGTFSASAKSAPPPARSLSQLSLSSGASDDEDDDEEGKAPAARTIALAKSGGSGTKLSFTTAGSTSVAAVAFDETDTTGAAVSAASSKAASPVKQGPSSGAFPANRNGGGGTTTSTRRARRASTVVLLDRDGSPLALDETVTMTRQINSRGESRRVSRSSAGSGAGADSSRPSTGASVSSVSSSARRAEQEAIEARRAAVAAHEALAVMDPARRMLDIEGFAESIQPEAILNAAAILRQRATRSVSAAASATSTPQARSISPPLTSTPPPLPVVALA